jgi:hypothetical protein
MPNQQPNQTNSMYQKGAEEEMNLYLILGGAGWVIFDGAASIYHYWKYTDQGWKDHAVRVARMGVGVLIIIGGLI